MPDTVFSGVGVSGSQLKAVDNSDGTYLVSVEPEVGADPSKDVVFNTWPPLKAVYLGVDAEGNPTYAVAAELV